MELNNLKELSKIIKFCRKHGVLKLKHGAFEVCLAQGALFPSKPGKEIQSEHIPVEGPDYLNDPEAAIDWSSSGAQ